MPGEPAMHPLRISVRLRGPARQAPRSRARAALWLRTPACAGGRSQPLAVEIVPPLAQAGVDQPIDALLVDRRAGLGAELLAGIGVSEETEPGSAAGAEAHQPTLRRRNAAASASSAQNSEQKYWPAEFRHASAWPSTIRNGDLQY